MTALVTHRAIDGFRAALDEHRTAGRSIGFVPTMGYLHAGHRSLLDRARAENDVVAASIFVNPLQFAPDEDLRDYPRDLDRDIRLCRAAGVDVLFVPSVEEMYPEGAATTVSVGGVSEVLEGVVATDPTSRA